MTAISSSPLSVLRVLGDLGTLDVGAREPVLLPGDGTSLLPFWDGGNPRILSDGKLAGMAFVDDTSASVMTEYMLLRDTSTSTRARYPDSAPRLPGSSPADAVVDANPSPYTTASGFLAGVRGDLSLASNENATYARSAARRFRVLNVGNLAGSLSEQATASKKITKLTGVDANNNPLEGWVYVETATTLGSDTLVCQVHQIAPAAMILPPSGTVTLVAYNNPNNWDLPGLISAKAAVGMQYCRGVCWITVVPTTAALQSAGIPSGPSTPSGVENWS